MIRHVTNGATVLTIGGSDNPIYLVAEDGDSFPDVENLSARGPFQHGEGRTGYRLSARTIQWLLHLQGTSLAHLYELRAQLRAALNPEPGVPLIVRWELPSGAVREIEAHVAGVAMGSADREGFTQKAAVSLYCPDPTFYNPAEVTSYLSAFEDGTDEARCVVGYPGDWPAYPVIEVHGPLAGPRLENETTGEVLHFPTLELAADEVLTITTAYGDKGARTDQRGNVLRHMAADSALGTWHLAPGVNSLCLRGSGAETATYARLRYRARYVGL